MNQDANTSPFTLIGRVDRSHGLHGEVKILLEFDDLAILDELNLVYLQNERGDYFPVRITEIRIEEKRNEFSFFVQFENIADRTAADRLKNSGIYLETETANLLIVEEEIDSSLIHFDVFNTQDEHIGTVMEVLEGTAQTVLNISSNKGTLLVPLVEHYIVEINEEEEYIICQNETELQDLL
mgnify:CR=1 FL=1